MRCFRQSVCFLGGAALWLGLSPAAAQDAGDIQVETRPVPGSSAPPAPSGGEKKASSGTPGGYAWSDAPPPRRRRRVERPKITAETPIATYPGFFMRSNGASQIFVTVTKRVNVVRQGGNERAVVFLLQGSAVAVYNNTNPLVTTFFDTPVSKIQLVRSKEGAKLVVSLRQPAALQHRILDGPGGTVRLVIDVPPSRSAPSTEPVAARQPQTAPRRSSPPKPAPRPARKSNARGEAKASGSFSFGTKK